jgi:WD40 repeat protein
MKLKSYHLILLVLFLFQFARLEAQFSIQSPINTDTLTSGTTTTIQLQNQTNTTVKLSFSNDYGSSWTLIKDSLSSLNYQWLVPSLDTGKCLIKAESKGYSNPYLIWEKKFAHTAEIRSVEMSKDGKYILSSGNDNMVKIWDILTKNCVDSVFVNANKGCYSAHFIFSNDSILITAGNSGYIWNRNEKINPLYAFSNFSKETYYSAVNSQSRTVAVCSIDGSLALYDLNNITTPYSILKTPDNGQIYRTEFSPDGKLIAIASDSGYIYIYDWKTSALISKLGKHSTPGKNDATIWSIGFSPDSKSIASGGVDNMLRIWDIANQTELHRIQAQTLHVRAAKFHPLGNYILTAGLDSLIKQWDPQTGAQIAISMNHGNQVRSAEYSPTGDTIISAGRGDVSTGDFPIKLWKNIQYSDLSDTVLVSIKYPVAFKTNSIDTFPDKVVYLPVSYRNVPQTDTPKDLQFNGILKLSVPLELLDLKSNAIHSGKIGKYDTVSLSIPNFKWNDTVTLLKLRTLYSENNINQIRIIGIEFDKLSNYYLVSDTSMVQINPVCGRDQIKGLTFTGYATDMKVYPNPVSVNELSLEFDLVEDSNLEINIVNIDGSIIENIVKGMFKRGRYVYMYDLTNLTNGFYFVQMKQNRNNLTRELIILK